jgi:hypothetical protein
LYPLPGLVFVTNAQSLNGPDKGTDEDANDSTKEESSHVDVAYCRQRVGCRPPCQAAQQSSTCEQD